MKHASSPARHASPPARQTRDTIWFYTRHHGRLRRCGIQAEALALLEPGSWAGDIASDPTARPRTLMRHISWIRALAAVELEERGEQPAGTPPLVLTAAQVRFQLACDASPDLPDVLCF
jgi:hypothetical protein